MDARNHDLPISVDDHYPPEPQYGHGPGQSPVMNFWEALQTLRRGWRFPVYGCLIGLILAGTYVLSAKVPYKSSARILIDRSVNRYLQTNKIIDQPTFDETEVASQVYVLSSDSVIVPVIRSLKLTQDNEFVPQGNAGGVTMLDRLVILFKAALGSDAESAADRELGRERTAVEAMLKRLTVSREDVANVISVTFESQNAGKAADIANAVADTYISNTLEAKLKSTKIVGQWLQERLTELKAQATEAERALQNYKADNKLLAESTSLQGSELLVNLRSQLAAARLAVAEAKERLDLIRRTESDGILTALGTDALLNTSRSGKINF